MYFIVSIFAPIWDLILKPTLAVKYSMSWHFQWYGYQFFNTEFENVENKKPSSGISEPFKINKYIWKCSSVFQSSLFIIDCHLIEIYACGTF